MTLSGFMLSSIQLALVAKARLSGVNKYFTIHRPSPYHAARMNAESKKAVISMLQSSMNVFMAGISKHQTNQKNGIK